MSDDVIVRLGNGECSLAYHREIATAIRTGDLAGAEARLWSDLSQLHDPLVGVCEHTELRNIGVDGWTDLRRALASDRWRAITAVGLDISTYPDTSSDEPSIECSFYSDKAFPFSTADGKQIAAQWERSGTKWQGAFDEIDAVHLSLHGLGLLNAAIERIKWSQAVPAAGTEQYAAYVLAAWWLTLRYQQAIRVQYARQGLSRPMYLLIGANGVSPYLETVIGSPAGCAPVLPSDTQPRPQPDHNAVSDMPSGREVRRKWASDAPEPPTAQSSWLKRLLQR